MSNLEFVIVTGTSGAGKSGAINALEDLGFYCVDNMPPTLISKFAELCMQSSGSISRVAIVADSRGGEFFHGILHELDTLHALGVNSKILFLDAADHVLAHRYKETRRRHPLTQDRNLSIADAISMERVMLEPLRQRADYTIDTTNLSAAQLRERINTIFLEDKSGALFVSCMSFGFKYGAPTEADLVFDVRCFVNPFYIPELKHLTGLQKKVRDFVLGSEATQGFLKRLFDLIDYLLPLYVSEGKSQLVIGIGCTGGKHRSVAIAEALYRHLEENGVQVAVNHRDINKA